MSGESLISYTDLPLDGDLQCIICEQEVSSLTFTVAVAVSYLLKFPGTESSRRA